MTVPEKKQMNAGVELLLKRMETHPEEFTDYGKWVSIMQEIHKYAEPEESKALNDALKTLMMQKVTERVLEGLVDPKSESNPYLVKPSATGLGGATHARSSAVLNNTNAVWNGGAVTGTITLGNQTLDESTVEHMKAHLEALKVKDRDALVNKKPTTIFGKLFNYL